MSRNILVVDDEEQICVLVSQYLTGHGFSVSSATTSRETLQVLSQNPIDLVLLDISLANEDGLELLADIKRKHSALHVVILTGMGYVEDVVQEAHKRGADGYVCKAFLQDELLVAIQRTSRPTQTELQAAYCAS